MLTKQMHKEALDKAKTATERYLSEHGDGFPCGFAKVTAYVNGNTKIGKSFKACGFKKSHGGGWMFWNPSLHATQNVDAKLAGAKAYANVIRKHLGDDFPIYESSMLD